MADSIVIEALGDWGKQIQIPLERAMTASMQQFGKSSDQVTKQMMDFETTSARVLTPEAQKTREVMFNPYFRHLMKRSQYKKYSKDANRYRGYFKYAAWFFKQPPKLPAFRYGNDMTKLAKIARRGLAQRSWRWGLQPLGIPSEWNPIQGTQELYEYRATISGASVTAGWKKVNKLNYLPAIMPPGWKQSVETAAVNRTLGMVREGLRREVTTAMLKGWAKAV